MHKHWSNDLTMDYGPDSSKSAWKYNKIEHPIPLSKDQWFSISKMWKSGSRIRRTVAASFANWAIFFKQTRDQKEGHLDISLQHGKTIRYCQADIKLQQNFNYTLHRTIMVTIDRVARYRDNLVAHPRKGGCLICYWLALNQRMEVLTISLSLPISLVCL